MRATASSPRRSPAPATATRTASSANADRHAGGSCTSCPLDAVTAANSRRRLALVGIHSPAHRPTRRAGSVVQSAAPTGRSKRRRTEPPIHTTRPRPQRPRRSTMRRSWGHTARTLNWIAAIAAAVRSGTVSPSSVLKCILEPHVTWNARGRSARHKDLAGCFGRGSDFISPVPSTDSQTLGSPSGRGHAARALRRMYAPIHSRSRIGDGSGKRRGLAVVIQTPINSTSPSVSDAARL